MGAAGDMLLGALYELLPDQAAFTAAMNRLHPDICVKFDPAASCGIAGTHARVIAAGQEEHSHDHSLTTGITSIPMTTTTIPASTRQPMTRPITAITTTPPWGTSPP